MPRVNLDIGEASRMHIVDIGAAINVWTSRRMTAYFSNPGWSTVILFIMVTQEPAKFQLKASYHSGDVQRQIS